VNHNPGRGAVRNGIVVVVPVELKSLVAPFEALIATARATMRAGRGSHAIDYAAIEREVEERTAEVERATHVDLLRSLDVDAPRVEIDGKIYRRMQMSAGTYYSMTGPLTVERRLYREEGQRNGPTVDAISLRVGVIGPGWLPKTAEAMTHHMQQGTPREAAASAAQTGRLPYSSASFDRVAHVLGKHWLSEHANIEDQLAQDYEIPERARSISIALDRVSIPIEEPRKRPPGRPRKNAPKNPIQRKYRMAYCGAVTIHDDTGEGLHTIRHGCMPESDPEALCTSMANEVYRLLERRPQLTISLLADGAPEMWNLLEGAFPKDLFGAVTKRIDFWHLIEKLAVAAKAIHGDEEGRRVLLGWRQDLRRRSSAADDILAQLQDSGCETKWVDSKQPVHDAITYIQNHRERMDYADALRRKLPIGSGAVEATCKTLVAVRMKRAGARWKQRTGEHIIRLRALALSDRWDPALAQLHQTLRTAVRPAA